MRNVLLLSAAIICSSVCGQSTRADSLLEAYLSKSKAKGIVAGYIRNGKRWDSAVGKKSSDETLSEETQIRIASITKIITAVSIMQLVEDGKIDLDERIDTYYSEVSEHHGAITVRQLLSHSSGIRAYQSSRERENKTEYEHLTDAYSIVRNDPLLSRPGEKFSYTSYGYIILGIIIEQVSGLNYDAYLKQKIFAPLSMNQTGIERQGQNRSDMSGVFHRSGNGKVKAAKRTNLSDRIPGGGVYSTVGDILSFSSGLLNGKLISEASFLEMITDTGMKKQGNPYGLGMYLYGNNPKYGNIVGHSGTQTGASAQLMFLTDLKAAVFVASNTSGIWEDMFYLSVLLFSEAAK